MILLILFFLFMSFVPSDTFITWKHREYLHFIQFASVYLVMVWNGYDRKRSLIICMILVILNETIQHFTGRSFQVKDIVMEFTGILILYKWVI